MTGYRIIAASDSEQVSATVEQDTRSTLMRANASAPQRGRAPLVNMRLLAEHNRWHHGGRGRGRCTNCGGCSMCGAADGRLTRPGRCVCALLEGPGSVAGLADSRR